MKNMTHAAATQKYKTQAGNVFFAIFGAIAIVGLLGAGLTTFVGGPLSSSVTLTRESAAQNQMVIGAQTALMGAASQASSGDCDLDSFVEPMPWRAAGVAPAPTGGGLIPNAIPAPKRDPWGTDYGYCVWDHGPTVDDAACGGPTQNRLIGTDSRGYPSLAMISAGPDKIFQTTCADFTVADANSDGDLEDVGDTKLVYKAANSDDMIFSYTYEEAVAATGDIWVLKSSDPTTAALDKKVEVGGGISFSGDGDFIGITADSFSSGAADFINLPGIRIPDRSSYTAACTPALTGVLRTNMSSVSPPAVVSSATDAQGFRDADSASVTFHSRPIAGNTVIVTVRGFATGGFALPAGNVTDSDGNTYVEVGSTGDATASSRVMMFAAYDISGASTALTVTINPTGATASGVVAALEVSGIEAGSLDITGNSTAANGAVSASGTTAAANSLAIGVIGVFGDDNIDSNFGFNSGADWRQPIAKNNIPSMAVVTKTFPSAASTVSHTWTYNNSTVTAVRKFMAVFTPTGASSSGGGSTPSIAISDINTTRDGTMDITAGNPDDFALWRNSDSLTPHTRRSGGGSLISDATKVGPGGTVAAYSSYPRSITWTGGTPTASGTSTSGIFCSGCSPGQGFELTFPASTTQNTARVYISYYAVSSVEITATLSDGSSPPITYTGLPTSIGQSGNEASAAFSIDYTAASPSATLTIRFVMVSGISGQEDISLNAASFKANTGSGGGGGSGGPITLVQQDTGLDSSTSAWVSAEFPGPVTYGNTILVGITVWNGEIYTVYDDRGNSYVKIAETPVNDLTRAYVFAANNVAAGVTTINTTSAGGSNKTITAYEFSGLANDNTQLIDQVGYASANGGTSLSVSAGGATTQADELIFALHGTGYSTANLNYQIGSGYTAGHTQNSGVTGTTYSSAYKVTTATETPTHNWTYNGPTDAFNDAVAAIVTLRGEDGQAAGGGGGGGSSCDGGTVVAGPPAEGGPGSPGPIAVVQRSAVSGHGNFTAYSETATFSTLPQAGNAVIVSAVMTGGGSDAVVSDNQGNRYIQILNVHPSGQHRGYMWIAENIREPVGTFEVTVTTPSDQPTMSLAIMEVAGLASDNTMDQYGYIGDTGGTTQTVTAFGATASANQLAIAMHVTSNSGPANVNYTRQGGWSEGHTENNASSRGGFSTAYRVLPAIETPSHTWTYNSLGGGTQHGSGIVTLRGYTAPPVTPTAASVVNQTDISISNTVSFTRAPTQGNSIFVMVHGWANNNPFAVTALTDNQGNTYDLVVGTATPGAYARNHYLYVAHDIPAPSGTFTITATTNPVYFTSGMQMTISAMEVAGLMDAPATTTRAEDMTTAPDKTITATSPTSEANEFAIAFSGSIVGADPGYHVKTDPTWRPVNSRLSILHSVLTKEIPAAGTTVSHTWNTYGNNVEWHQGILATFRTDPNFDFGVAAPSGPIAPPPNAPMFMESTFAYGGSGSLNVAKPAGTNVGDLLIWAVSIDGAPTGSFPYGFTAIDGDYIATPDGHTFAAAWKIADGTEPANFVATSGSYENISLVMRYVGFDSTQPIDASLSKAMTASLPFAANWPANTGSITTSVANSRVVWLAISDVATAIPPDYPIVYQPPSGFHERAELRHGQYGTLAVADKVYTAAGATGPINGTAYDTWSTAGGSAYNAAFGAMAFAIRPGDGGGSTDQAGPIEYVGSDHAMMSVGAQGPINLNVTVPDNIQAGDLIILAQATDVDTYNGDVTTISWPVGFTEQDEIVPAGQSLDASWAWKVADGSETNLTVNSSLGWGMELVMSVYRGVDPADPIGAQSEQYGTSDTSNWPYNVPGVNVPLANSSLVVIPFGDTGFEWGAYYGAKYFTPPTGFIERENSYGAQSVWAPIALFDRMGVAAGASGNVSGLMRTQASIDKGPMPATAGGFLFSLNPDPNPPAPPTPDPAVCSSSILQICDGTQWRGVSTAVSGGGISLDQSTNPTCDTDATSAVRYNASAQRAEYCNGTNWLPFSLGQAGAVLVANSQIFPTFNSFDNAWVTRSIIITNVGSRTSGAIGIALSGPDMAMFDYASQLGTSTCDDTTGLTPGSSCTIVVRGRSNVDGPFSAILEVTDPTNTLNILLQGTASGNLACSPGKLGFGGIIVSCINSTTPEYVVTGSGCGTGTNEPACSNLSGSGIDPQFTMVDTVDWPVHAQDIYTNGLQGSLNTANLLNYAPGWAAATYCNNLVKDGYDNWYLPSAYEWRSLLGPMAVQLRLDASAPNYWSSTFGFTGTDASADPHFNYYWGSAEEIEYHNNGLFPLYTRCLRKHGEATPAAALDPFVAQRISDLYYGWYGYTYGPVFKPLYSTALNTQTAGTATTITGINGMVPVTISGQGTPDFRWRAPAGVWSGYVTSASVGPGYEIQPRAFTPPAAGQEFAVNIKIGALNHIWKVRAIQTATRRIFVTSGTYNGNLGGLSGADATCQSVATAAGLGTSWYALLGGNEISAFERIPWNWNRIETMNSALIANNMGELEDTLPNSNPINRNQNNVATTTTNVWTGMYREREWPYFYGGEDCAPYYTTAREWTTNSSGESGRVGQINNANREWMDTGTTSSCNQSRRLYCVGPF